MMREEQLGFSCPRCAADLLVPASAAGAEGPCPKCGSVIRAPRFVAPQEEAPVRLTPEPQEPAPRAKPVTIFQPAPVMAQAPPPKVVPGWLKVAVVLLVLIAAVAGALVALRGASKSKDPVVNNPYIPQMRKPVLPEKKEPVTEEAAIEAALDPRVPPEGMNVGAMISRAAETLGRFLAAKSLDERLGMVETTTPRKELSGGALSGVLPVDASFVSTEVKFNKVENSADAVFLVDFRREDGSKEKQMVVVRTRGDQEPKILAEPFLDAYGGRMERFLEEPVSGEKVFRTIVTVFDFCKDERVPDHDQKFTAKFTTYPGGADVGKAYFAMNSPLAKKLEKLGLSYGRSIGATVVLKWSEGTEPFVEMADVRSLDWDS